MSIRHWPSSERPREKLLKLGAGALTEAELLAVLLRCGVRGKSVLDVARSLLTEFGSLRELLTAERDRLYQARGLGPVGYVALQASLELARRHYQQLMASGPTLKEPRFLHEFVRMRLRDLPYEVFCCLFLDSHDRFIAFDELFRGTIDGAIVYPREVLRLALTRNAAAVILVHNHPSGVAEPSEPDRRLTQRLTEALALVDIRVLDHIVVGDGHCSSFKDRGLL
jgi:DNA repair protein RadC